ncbi:MAG: ferritin [Spirochaetales bacterium]|jgi:ferritin|nr:ferritin [Spirochaetales bacterium]
MDKRLLDALNTQLYEEMNSAYLYLSMSSDMKVKNWKGASQWFQIQVSEESAHAMKFYHYMHDRGEQPVLPSFEKPQAAWDTMLDAFEATLTHERHISSCIHKLVDLAREVGDHATESFLQWFVTEQVEEEANADEIVQQIKMFGDTPQATFMLDRELGSRQDNSANSAAE